MTEDIHSVCATWAMALFGGSEKRREGNSAQATVEPETQRAQIMDSGRASPLTGDCAWEMQEKIHPKRKSEAGQTSSLSAPTLFPFRVTPTLDTGCYL